MAVTLNASTTTGLVQSADTSGIIELQSNGTTKATVSSSGLAIGQYNPSASLVTSGTAVASTSGTSIDFTSIPSWVKRITLMFTGVTTNGTSRYQMQLGAGSIQTTSYLGQFCYSGASNDGFSLTSGFGIYNDTAGQTINGLITFCLLDSVNYTWSASGSLGASNSFIRTTAGSVTLSGTLDRIRLTTINGTDSYNAGTINILYE